MKNFLTYLMLCLLFTTACREDTDANSVTYTVNPERSSLQWQGHTPELTNHGTISVSEDIITAQDNRITGGTFTMPLNSIRVLNLEGDLADQLRNHLLSEDFFHALLHPDITFRIRGVVPATEEENTNGIADANYRVSGELTFLGKSNGISFPAKIDMNEQELAVEALIEVDRLAWDMDYASDPENPPYILPDIDLHLKLTAVRQP